MRYTFFHRTESNTGNHKVKVFDFDFDTNDPAEALSQLYALGIPRGSARCGCFEIQNDDGIYSHKDGKRIDFTTARRAANVHFTSWDA